MILPIYAIIYLIIFGAVALAFIIATIIIIYQCIMDRPKKPYYDKSLRKEIKESHNREDY